MSESARSGAWAAQLIQSTYREGDRCRDEQFMENALFAWLGFGPNRQRFLSAFGVDGVEAEEILISTQQINEILEEGRADIALHFREEIFRVELKLWATLAPAQRGSAYAEVFIVPRGRVASVQRDVGGSVIGWETRLERLAGSEATPDNELERLQAFYEGMTYGTHLVEWPAHIDLEKLTKLRAAGRLQFHELFSVGDRTAIKWDAVDWFTCTLRNRSEEHALDLKESNWWWFRPYGNSVWEPDTERDEFDPDLRALARAMGDLWWTVVKTGLAAIGEGTSELRWDDDWGFVFGRYFWCGEYAVEALLTLGDHPDARVLGLVVWTRSKGKWNLESEAWWPKDASTSVDEWRKELVMSATLCSEGDLVGAFEGLTYAVAIEYE